MSMGGALRLVYAAVRFGWLCGGPRLTRGGGWLVYGEVWLMRCGVWLTRGGVGLMRGGGWLVYGAHRLRGESLYGG